MIISSFIFSVATELRRVTEPTKLMHFRKLRTYIFYISTIKHITTMRKLTPLLLLVLFQLSILSACQQKAEDKPQGSVSPGKPAKSLTDGLFGKKFEGILHMKISAPEGSQDGSLYISKNGTRFEMNLADPETGKVMMHIVTFTPSDEPNLLYTLNEKAKTYSVMDMNELQEELAEIADKEEKEDFKVEKLGTTTLHGYKCTHVRITERHGETEMWLTKDLINAADFARLQPGKKKGPAAFDIRLKKAGLDGFPLKTWDKESNTTMEFVKIERKKLQKSLFEVPSGYTKKESALQMMVPQISDEDMKELENMREMMNEKDMKEMEEMMKNMQNKFEGRQVPGQ